ncbi:MAG: hypothetical protein CVU43_24445 [Chloroflexi bacterium HGW-Chloroflexi-5]|jgi:rhodanese-related sulfurtransferase|nr:MAG: hypothetical protein CVU43_24445 [Chloroflexi bacterium HGW-Chloroflexi-5]PKP04148.1 MAG: hypothetical protein CVU11_05955 [Bacteroidetes bacterium HGW-Bacteroidetes-6]
MNQHNCFSGKTFISSGFPNLTPRDAYEILSQGKAILLDVRDPAFVAFKQFDVPEVLTCHYKLLSEFIIHLPASRPLIIADAVGLFSNESTKMLIEVGFSKVANLAGGMVEWERDGLPVVTNINERLSGSCVCQLRPRERE